MLYDQLWPFQKDAHNFAINTPGNHTALFCEQGTGKTWIACSLIEEFLHPEFTGLIVAPLSTIQAPDGWRSVLDKIDIQYCLSLDEFKETVGCKVLLVNWEAMGTRRKKAGRPAPKSKKFADFIIKHKWDFVCFDESQKMKARNSKQSRLASRIKHADYRLILSGTPFDKALDDPQEVWAQWRFLNPDTFGKLWADFDGRYLERTGWMGKQRKFRRGQAKKVFAIVKPNSLRVTKEVLNLDPVEYIWCGVSMLGKQRQIYDQMTEHSVVITPEFTSTAELEITKMVRQQQICGGHIKDDDEEIHDIGRAKLRKLKSILKTVDYPVIIYAKYIYEVLQVAEEVSSENVNVATIIGKTRRTRGETIDDFQKGKIDILISQVRTGGLGINLQRSHNAIFYSTTFSWIDFDQAVSRLHRAGQEKLVKIFLLFCKFSIDRRIYKVIISKRNVNEQILRLFTHHS